MARRSRQSILKRQRELKRLEKAQLKRQKREERRRKLEEGEVEDDYIDGEEPADENGVESASSGEQSIEDLEPAAVVPDAPSDRRDEPQ